MVAKQKKTKPKTCLFLTWIWVVFQFYFPKKQRRENIVFFYWVVIKTVPCRFWHLGGISACQSQDPSSKLEYFSKLASTDFSALISTSPVSSCSSAEQHAIQRVSCKAGVQSIYRDEEGKEKKKKQNSWLIKQK